MGDGVKRVAYARGDGSQQCVVRDLSLASIGIGHVEASDCHWQPHTLPPVGMGRGSGCFGAVVGCYPLAQAVQVRLDAGGQVGALPLEGLVYDLLGQLRVCNQFA